MFWSEEAWRLIWLAWVFKTFETFLCVTWSGYEDGDRCRKILGEIVHGFSGFFVKLTCDGAGDVLGGGIDGLPLIYQLD